MALCDRPLRFPVSSLIWFIISTVLFLGDVVGDIWAIVSLYQEGKFVYMGMLIAILVFSSILIQIFSWMWDSEPETNVDKFVSKHGLRGPLLILQLGLICRFVSMAEIMIRKLSKKNNGFEDGVATFLKNDLSMLQLFETFFESVPQLVLLVSLSMQEQELQAFIVLKTAFSFISIASNVVLYYRDMRKLVHEKDIMGLVSLGVYFVWNLLLITSRLVAVALFVSVLPCYFPAHFLCLWFLLFLWAWRQKTDFMDTEGGEWLYRATVGLIWYFSWFNVLSGNTKVKCIIYHVFMVADTVLLLGLWFWKRSLDSARLAPLTINPYVLMAGLAALYIFGLLMKLLYYWRLHPKNARLNPEVPGQAAQIELHFRAASANDLESFEIGSAETEAPRTTAHNKRIRNMAENFFYEFHKNS